MPEPSVPLARPSSPPVPPGMVGATLLLLAAGTALAFLPYWGVDWAYPTMTLAGAPAVGAVFDAFATVEVIAALVPGWRALRLEEREGRPRLFRAAVLLAMAMLAVQAAGMTTFLATGTGELATLRVSPAAFGIVLASTWLGALAVVMLLVTRVGPHALGGGFALLLLTASGYTVLDGDPGFWTSGHPWEPTLLAALALAGATLLVHRDRLAAWVAAPARSPRAWLPLPAAGLLPPLAAFGVLYDHGELVARASGLGHEWKLLAALLGSDGLPSMAGRGLVAAMAAVLLGWLLLRPSVLAARWQAEPRDAVRVLVRALLPSAGLVALVAAVSARKGGPLSASVAVGLVLLVSVGRDAWLELRFRSQHGDVITALEVQRPELLGPLRHELERRAIPVHFASLSVRSLLQIFGPLVPVRVLVPAREIERAREAILPEVWR